MEVWTKEKIVFLIKNRNDRSVKSLSVDLELKEHIISKKINELGLKKYDWTTEKSMFLIKNFHKMTGYEIALELNISPNFIYKQSKQLGLKK